MIRKADWVRLSSGVSYLGGISETGPTRVRQPMSFTTTQQSEVAMTLKSRDHSGSGIRTFILLCALFCVAQQVIAAAVDPDIPRIQAGADRGSIPQEIELGAAYFTGRGVPRDEKQAAYWYEKAANSGNPDAQLQIGYFYQAGIGVTRDPARAVRWFERAVAGGSVEAKVDLGVAYIWGLGVRKDPAFAAKLFREAAVRGSGTGACYLGDSYFMGLGVPKDESEAIRWFERGAKLHNPAAEFNLALILAKKDRGQYAKRVEFLRASAAAGYVPAKHQLGLLITNQPELAASRGENIALLEEAAADGFWRSSVVLGILARDGRGVPKDREAAYLHFRIAVLQGGANAATLLANDIRSLSSELTEAKIQSLDAKATAWMQTHSHPFQFAPLQARENRSFPAYALEYPTEGAHAGKLIAVPENDDGQDLGPGFH